ncbi:MAG: flagellar hook-length control protein FliK [Pseudomonadales bacterium]
MNSAGQSLNSNGLLAIGETPSAVGIKKLTSTADKSNNSLNNNEFSGVLEDQKQRTSTPTQKLQAAVTGIEEISPEQLLPGVIASEELVPELASGNILPAEGLSLPLDTAVANVTVQIHSEDGAAVVAFEFEEAVLVPAIRSAEGKADADVVVAIASPEIATANTTSPTAVATSHSQLIQQGQAPVLPNGALNVSKEGRGQQLSANPLESELTVNKKSNNADKLQVNSVEIRQPALSVQTTAAISQPFTVDLLTQFSLKPQRGNPDVMVASADNTLASIDKLAALSNSSMLTRTEAPQTYRESSPATFQTAVPVEVGKPGWGDTVMQRVMWMSSQNISKAEIALDPPELGPLQVRISTQAEQTTVVFTSSHGLVREALDLGLPRLREMMENQGLDLADVDVSDQNTHQQEAQADDTEHSHASGKDSSPLSTQADMENALHESGNTETLTSRSLSLVDQYV